jgi:hypothetical protein
MNIQQLFHAVAVLIPLNGPQVKLLIANHPQRPQRGVNFILQQRQHRSSFSEVILAGHHHTTTRCGQTILRKGQQTGSAWTINYEVRKAMFIFTFTRRRVGKAILLPLSGGEFTGNHPARR